MLSISDLSNIPEYSTDFTSASNNMPMTTTFPVVPQVDDSIFKNNAVEKQTSAARSSASSMVSTPTSGQTGGKRKQSQDKNLNEPARIAAEEDKRRRNTAASARSPVCSTLTRFTPAQRGQTDGRAGEKQQEPGTADRLSF